MSTSERRLTQLRKDDMLDAKIECRARHLLAGVMGDTDGDAVLVRGRGFGQDLSAASSGPLVVRCSCKQPAQRKVDLAAVWQAFQAFDPQRRTALRIQYNNVAWRGHQEA